MTDYYTCPSCAGQILHCCKQSAEHDEAPRCALCGQVVCGHTDPEYLGATRMKTGSGNG